MTYACNSSTYEAKTEELSLRPNYSTKEVPVPAPTSKAYNNYIYIMSQSQKTTYVYVCINVYNPRNLPHRANETLETGRVHTGPPLSEHTMPSAFTNSKRLLFHHLKKKTFLFITKIYSEEEKKTRVKRSTHHIKFHGWLCM